MDDDKELVVVSEERFDLAQTDGVTALKHAEEMIRYLAAKCAGPQFVSRISGKQFPKVEWWTTVGAGFGLFPREESCLQLEREGETAYLATVGVYRGDKMVSRASAMCSSRERTWNRRDENAIRSMSITRATGKAYRIAFSFLAVMAGLEPTPAEEMPETINAGYPDAPVDARQPDAEIMLLNRQFGAALREAYASGYISKDNYHKSIAGWKKHYSEKAFVAKAMMRLEEHCHKEEELLRANTEPAAQPPPAAEQERELDIF